jgi:LemA protein
MLISLLVFLGIGFLFIIFVVGIYNGLVALRNQYRNAFAQIDVQLKRRYDLIPNLVETVKGFMKHEQETLEKVIQARNAAYSAQQAVGADPSKSGEMKKLMQAESQVASSLGRLLAVSESYPELRSSENMGRLQEELSSTENKISFARQAYNDAVMVYNTKREVFPSNIIASMFNFYAAELWEIANVQERENVAVKFT